MLVAVATVPFAPFAAFAHQGASSRTEPGLAQRRDILYFEDFESHGEENTTTDPGFVLFGTKVLKVLYQAGQNGTVGKPRSPRFDGLDRAHLRFYVMFEEGYEFHRGGKLMGFMGWAPGKRAGWGGRKVHGDDGWLKLWVDGKLVKEQTDLRFRDIPELKIDRLFYSHYFGGKWKCPKDQYVYNDNIVVALDYIGPARYRAPRAARKERKGPSIWGRAKTSNALAPYAERIRAARELRSWIIEGASAGREETVWVDLFGRSVRGKFISADEDGFVANAMEAELPVRWENLKPRKLHAIASRYAPVGGLVPDGRAEALDLFAKAYGLEN